MLKSLFIRNYVLIDKLDIRFGKGLSVITGETGAGKSVILGALSLVLGGRADGRSIRTAADKCLIEAVFDIAAYGLLPFFEANELEYDAESCILRRELFASGKSRAFVNDSPISLSVLKELGSRLIDIHSQHQNLLLGDNSFQLKAVDLMAKNAALLQTYHTEYARFQSLQKELKALTGKARQSKQDEDYIHFQFEQLLTARLLPEEQESLEQEQELLVHAEEIKTSLYKITTLLQGDGQSSLRQLKEALTTSEVLQTYYPKAKDIAARLRTAYIDLTDLATETAPLAEDSDFNPDRLAWVNDRLNTLYDLQQKHRASTVAELIALRDKYAAELNETASFDNQIEVLRTQAGTSRNELFRLAALLYKQRQSAAKTAAAKIAATVAPLGMPNARFAIAVISKEEPAVDGMDEVSFLFSAHKNGDLQPVSQIASGGEISRLMLCVKAMIAGSAALPAIIFDEVDTGVSGDIADKMGEIMQALGRSMQVITITHLPQIASKGQAHYLVYKEDTAEAAVTGIRQLNGEERLREVARMLSGATLTEASLANARELLKSC
ncbi:Recombination protein N [Bacteroidales bacterium Barb6XT]|nr:Recombination protein N [Bacteroidales bacterium Barb6XT]